MEKQILGTGDRVRTEGVSKSEAVREPAVIVLGAGGEESPFAEYAAQDGGGEQVSAVKAKRDAGKTLSGKHLYIAGVKREDLRGEKARATREWVLGALERESEGPAEASASGCDFRTNVRKEKSQVTERQVPT